MELPFDLLGDATMEASTAFQLLSDAAPDEFNPAVNPVVIGFYSLILVAFVQLVKAIVPAALNVALGLAAILVLGGSVNWYQGLPPTVQPLVLPGLVGAVVLVLGAVVITRIQTAVDETTSKVKQGLESSVEKVTAPVTEAVAPAFDAVENSGVLDALGQAVRSTAGAAKATGEAAGRVAGGARRRLAERDVARAQAEATQKLEAAQALAATANTAKEEAEAKEAFVAVAQAAAAADAEAAKQVAIAAMAEAAEATREAKEAAQVLEDARGALLEVE